MLEKLFRPKSKAFIIIRGLYATVALVLALFCIAEEVKAQTATTGLSNGLVGYWSFDEGSGSSAFDSSGNGNTVKLLNGTAWTTGKVGRALKFDGINDVALATYTNFLAAGDVTISAWINRSSTGGHNSGRIVDNGSLIFAVGVDSVTRRVGLSSDGGSNSGLTANNSISLGTWHHVAAVRRANGRADIYIDGTAVAINTQTGTPVSARGLAIGNYPDSSGTTRPFAGMIDEVRLYNRALTATEIQMLYQNGSRTQIQTVTAPVTPVIQTVLGPAATPVIQTVSAPTATSTSLSSGLVGYWSFDERSGSSAFDSSGNGNTVKLHNGTAWTTGKVGGALRFDGIDDVALATYTNFLAVGDVTISAWINRSSTGGQNSGRIVDNGYFIFGVDPVSKRVGLSSDGGNNAGLTANNVIALDTWHHAVAVRRANGRADIYIDGTVVATNKDTGTPVPARGFAIGNYPDSSGTVRPFAGLIDEVRLYNRALTATEIQTLYQNGSGNTVNTVQAFDFLLSNSGNRSINAGSSTNNSINAALISGSSQSTAFSVSGVPAGTMSSFSSGGCNPNCSTDLTISTTSSTPAGSFPINVTAIGGGLTRTTNFTLTVAPVASPTTSVNGMSSTSSTSSMTQTASSATTSPSGLGNVYYVSKNGNDSNPGTQTQPWLTIQKAANSVAPGDTVVVKAGTYYERISMNTSGSLTNRITFVGERGSNGEWLSIIDGGSSVDGTWVQDGMYYKTSSIPYNPWAITVDGKHMVRISNSNMQTSAGQNWLTTPASATKTVLGREISSWDGIEAVYGYSQGTTYVRFRNGDNPNLKNLRVSPGPPCEYCGAEGAVIRIRDKAYITIRGFRIQSGQNLIQIGGTNAQGVVIEENALFANDKGIFINSDASNNIVRNNIIELNSLSRYTPGAWGGDPYTAAVRRHIYDIYKTIVSDTGDYYSNTGIFIMKAGPNNEVYRNQISKQLFGIQLDRTSKLKIYDNQISNMSSVGIYVLPGSINDVEISGNLFSDSNANIRIQHQNDGSRLIYIYNNRFYNPPGAGRHFELNWFANATSNFPDVYVYQNSFAGGGNTLQVYGSSAVSNYSMLNYRFINNVFSSQWPFNADIFRDSNGGVIGAFDYNWVGGSYNLQPWFGSYNVNTQGQKMWNDGSMPDFSLPATSSARNSGLDLSRTFVVQGQTFPPLPGMNPGYFSGTRPNLGAMQ